MGLLMAFLKLLGKGAMEGGKLIGKGALGLGKTVAKTALKPLESLYKEGAKGLLKQTEAGKLAQAFQSLVTPSSAEAAQLPVTEQQPPNIDLGRIRVPGPQGTFLEGQGEAMPGYGMQPGATRIPPAYQNMMPQQPQQMGRYPGVFAGIKEGLLGMPSTAGEPQPSEKGRQTAYYAGKLIPDIIRSRMGVSTTGQEARQQQMLEATIGKKVTPEYKKDLQEAVTRLSNPELSETDKIMIYQQLVTVYPERSAEIKRIFFPQSGDNFDDLLKGIIAGNMYGR